VKPKEGVYRQVRVYDETEVDCTDEICRCEFFCWRNSRHKTDETLIFTINSQLDSQLALSFSLVHLVKPTTQKEPAPLLLMLHGYGANEYDLIGMADALDSRFTVISVRAPLSLGNGSYAWFPLAFTDEGIKVLDTKAAIQSRALILKFLRRSNCTLSDQSETNCVDGI
jgi:hypothetical protein